MLASGHNPCLFLYWREACPKFGSRHGTFAQLCQRPTDQEAIQGLSVQEGVEGREDIHNHVVPREATFKPFQKGRRA